MKVNQWNDMEAPTDNNQNTQEESLPSSSNQGMEQSESDSVRQHIRHKESLEQLKLFFQNFKNLLEKSQDYRLFREANLLLFNEFRAPIFTPNQVRASSLNTLKSHPLIWATYIRGNNKNSSSKSKTPVKQPETLEPGSSGVTKRLKQKKKLRSKMLMSRRNMTIEKFMDEFYQYLLTKI